MKAVLIVLLVLVASIAIFAHVAMAQEPMICTEVSSGAQYGAHIAEHAQEGQFGPEHNPGQAHLGYSLCVR